MAGNRPGLRPAGGHGSSPTRPRLPDDVLVTGGIAGDGSLEELTAHGSGHRRRGRPPRRRRSPGPARCAAPTRGDRPGDSPAGQPAAAAGQSPRCRWTRTRSCSSASTHGIVDFSEDVSSKDLTAAVAEGFDSAPSWPSASRPRPWGRCRASWRPSTRSPSWPAPPAARSPRPAPPPGARRTSPVTLGALAGQAVRAGALLADAALARGARRRAADRGGLDPAGPLRRRRRPRRGTSARTSASSTSPRSASSTCAAPTFRKLLNLLYVNKWSKLEIGRVRYGVMCAEDGVVLDDGVTGRLGDEHYLMSTTSSGAATVWEWAENWLQTEHPDWRVHVTPVTTAYASINVAGPKSRQLIERVTEGVDLSNEAFPYMHVRTGTIAGVDDSVLWRIGFTGELSYELHVPAGYGLHVWEALLAAGRRPGRRPVRRGGAADPAAGEGPLHRRPGHRRPDPGVQRRAGLGDQAGQGRLRRASRSWPGSSARASAPELVGLQPVDGSVVPEEASLIMDGAEIAGRITSSRMSPTLRPVHLPGPGGCAPGRAGHRGHRAAAQRPPDRGPGHAAACPRRPGRRADACLTSPLASQPDRARAARWS